MILHQYNGDLGIQPKYNYINFDFQLRNYRLANGIISPELCDETYIESWIKQAQSRGLTNDFVEQLLQMN